MTRKGNFRGASKSRVRRANRRRALRVQMLEDRQLLAFNIMDDAVSLTAEGAINVLANDESDTEVQTVSAFNADLDPVTYPALHPNNDTDWFIPMRDDGVTPQRSLIEGAVMFNDDRADGFNGGANRGDIDLLRDTDTDPTNDNLLTAADALDASEGIGIATMRDNRPVGENEVTGAANANLGVPQFQTEGGGPVWIALAAGPENNGEHSVPVGHAFFPYSGGWVGGSFDSAGGQYSGSDADGDTNPDITVTGGGGIYEAEVQGVTDSYNDGFLFSIGGDNEDNYTRTRPIDGGKWAVQHRDNSAGLTGSETDDFNLLYIPRSARGLIGGVVNAGSADANPMIQSFGDFTIQRETDGFWRLNVPNNTARDGVLIMQTYDLTVDQPRNAYFTYEEASDDPNDIMIRQFEWTSTDTEQPLNTDFVFFYVPFENNLAPVSELDVTELGTDGDPTSGLTELGYPITLNADKTVDYFTDGAIRGLLAGETNTDTFVYSATDGLNTGSATVTIEWVGQNDAPYVLAAPDPIVFEEDDAPLVLDLTTVFADYDVGDVLTYEGDTGQGDLVTIDFAGDDATITPVQDAFGFTRITLTAIDTAGESVSVVVDVLINQNDDDDGVVAVDDTTVTDLITPVDVAVLDNDYHPETSKYSVSAANILGSPDNSWAVIDTTASPNDLTIQSAPNTGDVAVGREGLNLSLTDGVFLGTPRDNTTPFMTVNTYPAFGSYGFATDTGIGGGESQGPVNAAFFPFAEGWTSGHIAADGTFLGGVGVSASDVEKLGPGRWRVTIPEVVFNGSDGLFFAMGGSNDDNIVSVRPDPSIINAWEIRQMDSDSDIDGFEDDPISFVYIPGGTTGLIGGRAVDQEGSLVFQQQYGNFIATPSFDNTSVDLSIDGYTSDDGVVIAIATGSVFSTIGGVPESVASNHAVLATPNGNDFSIDILNSADYSVATSQNGGIAEFQFVFLPYDSPLERVDGLDFSITSVDAVSTLGAAVSLNPDMTVNYDPSVAGPPISDLGPGESLEDTFTYTITDGRGDSSTATVTVTVQGENQDPTANDDFVNLNEVSAQGALLTVLGNDYDPDLDVILGAPEYTVAGNLAVDGSSNWSVAQTGTAPNEITLGAGTTGDVEVLRNGVAIAPADGVVLATVRENYDGAAENYRLVQSYDNGLGGTSLAVQQFGTDGAADAPVSVAYFPFADNWVGGHVDAAGVLTNGSGLVAGDVSKTDVGRYQVAVPNVVDAAVDGFLFVIGNENADNVAHARAVPGTNVYEVAVRDNTQDFGDGEDGGFSFVFVPRNAQDLVAGTVDPFVDGPNAVDLAVGEFNIQRQDVGDGSFEYLLTIPGHTPETGMLVLTNQDNGELEDNFLSYQDDGAGNFLIRSHDMPGIGRQNQPFTFAFVPFENPGRPVARPVVDLLNVTSVDATSALGATLTVNPDNTISYDPGSIFDSLYDGDVAVDTFTYTMDDGFGGSDMATVTVTIDGFGAAPVLLESAGNSYYGLGDIAVGVAPQADIVPVGTLNLDGAILTAETTTGVLATDELSIRNEGTGAGQVGVSGSDVTFGGTVIGTFAGGTGTTPLEITFNAAADEAAADAVLRAISFSNTDAATFSGSREVVISLVDEFGFASNEITEVVDIDFIRRRTLQQGVDYGYGVYGAAADAQIREAAPDSVIDPAADFLIDFDASGNASQGLLKFGDIFGPGPGQIPVGSVITSARLVVETNPTTANAPGDGGTFHRMVQDWDPSTATWNAFGSGLQNDGVEGRVEFDSAIGTASGAGSTGTGVLDISVLPDVRAWAGGEDNFGWMIQGWVGNTDGWFFSSSEDETPLARPKLELEWMPPGIDSTSFREGVNGYAGTVDTRIRSNEPDLDRSTDETLFVDSPTDQTLMRFEGIIGEAVDQVPANAKIVSARLRLASTTSNAQGDGASFHTMLNTWADTDTYNSLVDGVSVDGVEASSEFNAAAGNASRNPNVQGGWHDFDVTQDVQDWVYGTKDNFGWVFNFWPSGTDGWGVQSSEAPEESERPRLEVFYVVLDNTPPFDISLDNSEVAENTDTTGNLAVGDLSATDPDAGESHTFALVSGTGDDDNALFAINGTTLEIVDGTNIDFESQPSYTIRVEATDLGGLTFEKVLTIDVINRGEVESVVIGNGLEPGQDNFDDSRSRVESLTVTFDQEVTLGAAPFVVEDRGGAGAVDVAFTSEVIDGKTVATLTFSGPLTDDGSLVNGNYELTIVASEVTDALGNNLDGDQDGMPGGDYLFGDEEVDQFYRLYGDYDGNRVVNFDDFFTLRDAFGASNGDEEYRRDIDVNGDGVINFDDFFAFRDSFGDSQDF